MRDFHFNTVQEFNDYYGLETLHPLVNVVRFNKPTKVEEAMYHYGLYALFLKENKGCKLSYGRTEYDFDEMTVTSFAPGQVIHVEPNPEVIIPKWTAIVFHPDLLNRTSLGKNISRYEFFDYTSNEALHLSIVNNIELLLNYCLRFYDRQFITREEINHSVVKKFTALLDQYIANQAQQEGFPSVAYFADKCCYSPKYFGELVKTETGRTAKDFISDRMLIAAKQLLNDESLSIKAISQQLGFEYPQHFIRFFKAKTGQTPSDFRKTA